jgi:hypothetical protein
MVLSLQEKAVFQFGLSLTQPTEQRLASNWIICFPHYLDGWMVFRGREGVGGGRWEVGGGMYFFRRSGTWTK